MLKNILAISGKPGLFKLVSRGTNMLIVESLIDGKRIPTYSRDKIVSLAEVSMYTTGEDVSLSEVLNALGKKYNFKAVEMDAKKADNDHSHRKDDSVCVGQKRNGFEALHVLLYKAALLASDTGENLPCRNKGKKNRNGKAPGPDQTRNIRKSILRVAVTDQ